MPLIIPFVSSSIATTTSFETENGFCSTALAYRCSSAATQSSVCQSQIFELSREYRFSIDIPERYKAFPRNKSSCSQRRKI